MTTSQVQSVTCLRNMLEVCFSCESKILAQVRSATVVLFDADLREANLQYAKGITIEELEQQAQSLKGATMLDGSKHP